MFERLGKTTNSALNAVEASAEAVETGALITKNVLSGVNQYAILWDKKAELSTVMELEETEHQLYQRRLEIEKIQRAAKRKTRTTSKA